MLSGRSSTSRDGSSAWMDPDEANSSRWRSSSSSVSVGVKQLLVALPAVAVAVLLFALFVQVMQVKQMQQQTQQQSEIAQRTASAAAEYRDAAALQRVLTFRQMASQMPVSATSSSGADSDAVLSGPLSAALSPGLSFCRANPFLLPAGHTEAQFAAQLRKLEAGWEEWFATRYQQTRQVMRLGLLRNWHAFDLLAPVDLPFPCEGSSTGGVSDLHRWGAEGDGGKWICRLHRLDEQSNNAPLAATDGEAAASVAATAAPASPSTASIASSSRCSIMSLGSNNQFDFEEAMLAGTSTCTVDTYDCTSRPPPVPLSPQGRHSFHAQCLGDPDIARAEAVSNAMIKPEQMATYKTLLQQGSFHHVHLLKMDIEGAEYGVFDTLLHRGDNTLPYQISVELHVMESIPPEDIFGLFDQLWRTGYRAVKREDNSLCNICAEFTLLRVYC